MGWRQIPEFESSVSFQHDNPFSSPRTQPTNKISVKQPSDEWLCRKMEKLNITLAEGYSTRSSDTSGLIREQFVRFSKTQKWYVCAEKKDFSPVESVPLD